jgi:hypothetical protein
MVNRGGNGMVPIRGSSDSTDRLADLHKYDGSLMKFMLTRQDSDRAGLEMVRLRRPSPSKAWLGQTHELRIDHDLTSLGYRRR